MWVNSITTPVEVKVIIKPVHGTDNVTEVDIAEKTEISLHFVDDSLFSFQ